MNTKATGKTVEEVLDGIAPNNFVKKILVGKDEIPKTMAKMVEEGDYLKVVNNGIQGKNYVHNETKRAMLSKILFTYKLIVV